MDSASSLPRTDIRFVPYGHSRIQDKPLPEKKIPHSPINCLSEYFSTHLPG
jgi:hypothetical protein